jgi:hypothetical protein
MDANADVDLLSFFLVRVVNPELSLNLLGALDSVDDGGEVYQEGVTDGLDDLSLVLSDSLSDKLVMDFQQPQGAGFVAAHLAAKADDVSEHDRGQFAHFCRSHRTVPSVCGRSS